MLQTTRDEYLIRDSQRDGRVGVPVEFSKGEAGRGQHEINLEYAGALEMADRHVIYKNGAKEIVSLAGRSITFMAKYSMEEVGSSCHVHSSVWDGDGSTSLMWSDDGPHNLSDVFRGWLGGLLVTAASCVALRASVNSYKRYQPESWAPTALAWGAGQPDVRIPGRRPGRKLPGRVPPAGRRREPVPRVRGDDRRGLHGIEHDLDPGAPYDGSMRRRRPQACRRHWWMPSASSSAVSRGQGVRVRRARAPREHGPPGVGRLQPRRDRLGTPPQLRAVLAALTAPADCGARVSGEGGTGAGLGEAGVAAPTPYVEALQRAGVGGDPHARLDRRRRRRCRARAVRRALADGRRRPPPRGTDRSGATRSTASSRIGTASRLALARRSGSPCPDAGDLPRPPGL